MEMKEIINNIFWSIITVLAILVTIDVICDIVTHAKVISQGNCVEINSKYYCEVK